MKLRSQLALVSLLVLLLPLLAWTYLNEMHRVLQQSSQREMNTWSSAIAWILEQDPLLLNTDQSHRSQLDIYAQSSNHEIVLDGYNHDWSDLNPPTFSFQYADNKTTPVVGDSLKRASLSLNAAVSERFLYLYFSLADTNRIFHDPSSGLVASGDRLHLFVEYEGVQRQFLLRAIAPGLLDSYQVLQAGGEADYLLRDSNILAYWEVVPDGYAIEVRLPRPKRLSHFGFAFVDADDRQVRFNNDYWIGTVDPDNQAVHGRLLMQSESLLTRLQEQVGAGNRVRIFDANGWLMSEVNRLHELPPNSQLIDPATSSLLEALLFRGLSVLGENATADMTTPYTVQGRDRLEIDSLGELTQKNFLGRYRSDGLNTLGVMYPLGELQNPKAYLLIEKADDSVGAIVNSTLVRLFGAMFLLFIFLLFGLLLYAGWLSRRIRTINDATSSALRADGKLVGTMPCTDSADEIGELSRGIEDLLQRLSSYTEYLRTLASRLSHELRTPLAVVATSLESVEKTALSQQNQEFFGRAEDGAKRLQTIIRALSEATRLEQFVEHAEFAPINLSDWLSVVVPQYEQLYPLNTLTLRDSMGRRQANVIVSVELLQQLMDKLIANAVDFSPKDGRIDISVSRHGYDAIELRIYNEGEPIPESIRAHMFDAMVSARPGAQTEPHLGLGLYIVKIIVDAHQGRVSALNQRDGVAIRVLLPSANKKID